ncbi:MAG: DUF1549 and DUF1553 domain-containing protein [Gemmataceae bacterium]
MLLTFACLAVLLASESASAAEPVDFGRDVVPVLTKLGCNSGACHGSFQGRGGFRLSLLGFDPAADYDALVSEARGRRLFSAAPEKSLLLLKGTGQVGHGGKKKLDLNSDSYRTFVHWMNQGARRGSLPSVTKLDVEPVAMLLTKGEAKPLAVKATWSDGTLQDATKLALYESTKDTVAGVNSIGVVDSRGAGRASITVRFMGQVAAVPVSSPFSLPEKFDFPPNNFIDEHLSSEWKSLGLQPAPLCTDNEFLRRVMLDLIGTLPTPAEVNAFNHDADPKKRAKLIDKLLDRPEYADYWSLKWGDLLRAHRRSLGDKGLATFNGWLRQSLRENRPADRITRELLTAQGNLFLSGPVAFWFVDKLPDEFAETTAQVFLGTRLQCAKCHHHPFEVWTQDDYHGMAAFFTRIKRKDTGENGQFGGAQSLSVVATGTWTMPITGKPVAPRVLGGKDLADSPADPRATLAEWIVAKNNPLFAKSLANRYWGYLFGRGLVDPVDDLRATNPATFPALLDALTKDFTDHDFDLKHLLRMIANSRAYQLAGEVNPVRDADGEFVTHRRPKALPAEVMLDAVCAATGVPEAFEKMPLGTRAISLPDPAVASYFLDAFGRPKRVSACECERPAKADLAQILHLMNGEALQKKLASDTGRIGKLIATKATDAAIIDELYLATLSRKPTISESKQVLAKVAAAPTRREGFEDLLWALLNCPEFGFNH